MKSDCKHLLIVTAIIWCIVINPFLLHAQRTVSELDYDNYILVTVGTDGGITMTFNGEQSESVSPWVQSELGNLSMTIDVTVEDKETSIVDGQLRVQLDPAYYSSLANFDMDVTGHSDKEATNLTAFIDYLGYLSVNGEMGMVIVEPPYGFILDLVLETKLYYSLYPREQLQMILEMVPLLETQLASEVMATSSGNIKLDSLELMDYEETSEYAFFTVVLRLTGDLQKGLMSAYEEMGAAFSTAEISEELPPLTIGSFDYHVLFEGSSLTLDINSGGTLQGDLNTELNKMKDTALEEILLSNEIDSDARILVTSLQSIELRLQHLLVESTSINGRGMMESSFFVEGLGMELSSFEPLMVFLEELSDQELPEDFKLVLVGESNSIQYVAFNVPSSVTEPIMLEEQRIVWEMSSVSNLKDVTYEVKTKSLQTTTIIISTVVGLAVLGAAAYVVKSRM